MRSRNIYSGTLSPEELPGVKKKSFLLPFGGSEIWFEHIDGMYQYSELVMEKLKNDSSSFMRPSGTSIIGFVLYETVITDEIADEIVGYLRNSKKYFRRVCFLGADSYTKRMFMKRLEGRVSFGYSFINDFEKAKEWLIEER